jgi:anti-anti-sigma factor
MVPRAGCAHAPSPLIGGGVALLEIALDGPNFLRFSGDLDLSTEAQVTDAFAAIPGPLRLNMAGVTFMDSTGIRLLLLRGSYGGGLTLERYSDAVRRMLGVGGLEVLPDGQVGPRRSSPIVVEA